MYAVVLLVCCSWVALLYPSVQAYENLALHKTAWQSSTFEFYRADRAVDGLYTDLRERGGQCTVSLWAKRTAAWLVDLGGVKNIHHVFLQYVTDNRVWDEYNFNTRFFLGFSVYISNTTNKGDGVLCFRDTNYTPATIPNPVNISCPYHGRYVIYYNNRTHLPYPEGYSDFAYTVLCEVEVYGCPTPGRYGENCSLLCPENCNCGVIDKTCVECVPGYRGHLCYEECAGLTYGLKCNQKCGKCSGGVQCDHVTGICPNGCDAGMYGDRCDLACGCYTYGVECKQSCGNCSNGEPCHHVDGSCPSGCNSGAYGVMCKESCGNCSNGDTCNDVDGSCPYGCDVGVYGKTCDEACQSGRYGFSCAKACGQNCQGCNRFNGVCEFGCHPGWTGTFCEKRKTFKIQT
ncbi:uncharacterized protein LOC111111122 isoform X2 [Crassostrea virginica]|uniref:Multiple epidermal growth factor-like domains protein 10 isoform X2 n=1 Tax=Crassostrea virginica TaxID=6565 RepID=A0A8B8BJU3_CRAVI|nr:multiple epidermal growth factor-like domains protein 10 isoform X2 [Crassostrea virginica]XP_022303621.1 multiple epidermal growth factor-like domains protein 10 isoform X2 [Crassostrea virginica]